MIRFLAEDEKWRSKELYRQAFSDDSKEFLAYYFQRKTANNRIIVDEEDGKILSMANLNPYSMVFYSQRQILDYVVAVATDERYRRQGRMRAVLEMAFEEMYKERKPFTYLKPANKEYYLPFGFGFISENWETRPKEEVTLKTIILTSDKISEETRKEYAMVLGESYFQIQGISQFHLSGARVNMGFGGGLFDVQILEFWSEWLHSNVDVYTYRTQAYLEDLFQMLGADKGEVCLYFDMQNRLVGVHIYWRLEQMESLEFLGDLAYFDMISTKKADKMARIIHLEEFVQVFHLKQDSAKQMETLKFRVKDEIIKENNGTFLWHLNREFSYIERLENEDSLDVFEVDIGDFVSWAFGQKVLDGGYILDDIQRLHTVMINEEV